MALADILAPSFVEVGKIKIGTVNPDMKRQDGSSFKGPVKLDHFWVSTLHRDDRGVLIPDDGLMNSLKEFADPKDGKLRSLPILFGSNDPNEVMSAAYVWYIGKTLAAKSDGREVTFHFDPKTGQRLDEPRLCKWHEDYRDLIDPADAKKAPDKQRKLFRLFCSLNVMIASPAARWGGFYRFRTTSEISSQQLYGSLVHLRKLTGGVLRGLVFRLVVRPMLVTPNGRSTTVYVVHVEYVNSDLKQLQSAARDQLALERENVAALVETERQYKALVAAQVDEPEEYEEVVTEASGPSEAERQAERLERFEEAIRDAPTLADLRTAWGQADAACTSGAITKEQLAGLAKLKDERKDALAPPQQAAAEPALAGVNIVRDIERLVAEAGLSWGEIRSRYADRGGILPEAISKMTAEQALTVRDDLRSEAKNPQPTANS